MKFGNSELCIKDFNIDFLLFLDKTSDSQTFVVSTHGFVKKRSKVPDNEIQKAMQIREKYLIEKD
ncbi:hypothetical protein [Pedobacter alpinus]|uniref:Phage derived protein Gp49-like n=1 Tax=Pedobacter alpinus TaxID=1590643 RepID=A0ABW5TXE5_9SPHI